MSEKGIQIEKQGDGKIRVKTRSQNAVIGYDEKAGNSWWFMDIYSVS